MKEERVTVSLYPNHKPNRRRTRLGLTVDPTTTTKLKTLADEGEFENVSRGIDFVTEFFWSNRGAVPVTFRSPEVKAAFAKASLAAGKTPAEMLEMLAVGFLTK